jgi:hypothetical protein
VGITSYPDETLHHLHYCALDAQRVRDFLQTKYQIPTENIVLLTDGEATHDAIMTQFRSHLTLNTAIKRGNPIVFYFAGHGARYKTGHGYPDDHRSEAICPFDRGTLRLNGTRVPDILDRTLGSLLAELAEAKGDNITVIMDCCHAGSITRSGTCVPSEVEHDMTARYTDPIASEEVVLEMLSQADVITQVQRTRNFSNSKILNKELGLRHPDVRSHIVLAACGEDQLANESHTHRSGLFTHHLLTVLKKSDLKNITYASLIIGVTEKMPTSQHPQCEGMNKHRLLFDNNNHDNRLVPLYKEGLDNSLRVAAGAMHGVMKGTVFSVPHHHLFPSDVALVRAKVVWATWSIVEPTTSIIPKGQFARVSYWANSDASFKIGFSNSTAISSRQRDLQDTLHEGTRRGTTQGISEVYIVRDEISPQVRISADEKGIIVERKDELVKKSGSDLIFKWTQPRVDNCDWTFIDKVARFNFHLYRENPAHPYRDKVLLSLFTFHRLKVVGSDHVSKGMAKLQSSKDKTYVFVVDNRSNVQLWCSLYYFDPSNYFIAKMYAPPSSTMLPPLKGRSRLHIGQIGSGVPPFVFTVEDGELHDAGFVKLFISEQYADLSLIEQGGEAGEREAGNTRNHDNSKTSTEWDTKTIIIDVCA